MNPSDRFQALIRHPLYREEARVYIPMYHLFKSTSKTSTEWESDPELLELTAWKMRWGLAFVLDPEDTAAIASVLDELRAGDTSIFSNDLRLLEAFPRANRNSIHPGRHVLLSLYVDLERPTSELTKLFVDMVNQQRASWDVTAGRTRPYRVDPWKVWDMMQIPGNNLLQITRTICGVVGNPSYDDSTKQAYDQVTRAYEKANETIEKVGKSRNDAITVAALKAASNESFEMLKQLHYDSLES